MPYSAVTITEFRAAGISLSTWSATTLHSVRRKRKGTERMYINIKDYDVARRVVARGQLEFCVLGRFASELHLAVQ